MNKRLPANLLVALLVVTLAVSGGFLSRTASAQEEITLTMTAWDVATTPYWQAVIEAYEAANPNVNVELIDVPSAEYQDRSEERRVGKECRSRWWSYH